MTAATPTRPDFDHADSRDPRVAHIVCASQLAKMPRRGICGRGVHGLPATPRDLDCAVCADLWHDHAASCAPCIAKRARRWASRSRA